MYVFTESCIKQGITRQLSLISVLLHIPLTNMLYGAVLSNSTTLLSPNSKQYYSYL